MMSGVYKIRNIIDQKYYIGSTVDFVRREKEHFSALKNNNHKNIKLQNAITKHGIENFVFEIVERCPIENLFEIEQRYLDSSEKSNLYNISELSRFPIGNNAIAIVQLSLDNQIIDYHPSYQAAARKLGEVDNGVSIGAVVRGIQNTAYGFKWIKVSPGLVNEDFVEMSKSVNLRHSLIQKIHKLTGEIICEDKPEVFLEDLNIDRTTLWKHCKKMDLFKDFYWRRSQESQSVKFFMGCDVGKNGAISLIAEDKSIIWNFQMPKNSNEIDVNRLSTFLKFHKRFVSHCVVEDVHSIFGTGSKANFQFGRSLGLLEGVLIASKIPFTKITPKNWQSVIWEGVQPIEVNTGKKTPQGNIKYKTDTKATSLIAIKKLFPEANLTASDRSKKPSDGIVDSLAMAEYCRRKFK